MFWVIAALLTAGVAGVLAHPFMTSAAPSARRWGWVLIILVPALALSGYLWLGADGRPDVPLAQNPRAAPPPPDEARQALDQLIQNLQKHPDRQEDWMLLGETYKFMGRYAESAAVWQQAARLHPTADILTTWAETAVLANDGRVPADLVPVLDEALKINPRQPLALHLRALAYAQEGATKQANALWKKLVPLLPEGHPLRVQAQKLMFN